MEASVQFSSSGIFRPRLESGVRREIRRRADQVDVTMADGATIYMWGFALDHEQSASAFGRGGGRKNSAPVPDSRLANPRTGAPEIRYAVVAGNGRPYPQAKTQHKAMLPATGTLDAMLSPTPRRYFGGTDALTYTARDNLGLTSNVATARVNVTR